MGSGLGQRQIASLLNFALGRAPTDTPVGVVFVGLSVGDSGADGQSGAEATGAGYARVAMLAADWTDATVATPSVAANSNAVVFPTALGDWSAGVELTHFTVWATATGTTEADYIGRGVLDLAQAVVAGRTPNFPPGALKLTGTETA